MKLYFVRHAQVAIEPSKPPEYWHLSSDGMASARALAKGLRWEGVATVYHSPQPKTAETANAIASSLAIPMVAVEDLRELWMDPTFVPTPEFERRVGRYLEGARDPGLEDYWHAQERIVQCVRAIVADGGDAPLAMVTHGRILTVLFSALCGTRLGAREWKSIQMLDLSIVDLEAEIVSYGFFAGRQVQASVLRT